MSEVSQDEIDEAVRQEGSDLADILFEAFDPEACAFFVNVDVDEMPGFIEHTQQRGNLYADEIEPWIALAGAARHAVIDELSELGFAIVRKTVAGETHDTESPPVSGGADDDETESGARCQQHNDRMWAQLGPVADDAPMPW